MRLYDFIDEFLFDEFPKIYNPNQKVFCTHLLNLQCIPLLKQLPKIYTTKTLAERLTYYCHQMDLAELTEENFIFLTPYTPLEIRLSNNAPLKLLVCEADDISKHLMILIKEEGKVKHLYAGCCTHFRNALLNDKFAQWIRNGVDKLFVRLERGNEECNARELNKAIEQIEHILNPNVPNTKIFLDVHPFGCVYFLEQLAYKLRACVNLPKLLHGLYGKVLNMHHFQQRTNNAKVFIYVNKKASLDKSHYTVQVHESILSPQLSNIGKPIRWSPLPTPFELELLMKIVRPSHICGIPRTHHIDALPKTPKYLINLCKSRSPRKTKKQLPTTSTSVASEVTNVTQITKSTSYAIKKKTLLYVEESADENEED